MTADSLELRQLLVEAEDIAKSASHRLTTAHLLLAVFVAPNRARLLLGERGIDEDTLIECLHRVPKEPEGLVGEVLDRAREIAGGTNCAEADCGHLLIAITRVRSCEAVDLLMRCKIDLTSLRNTALSYYLGGHMPRRIRVAFGEPVRAQVAAPSHAPLTPTTHQPSGSASLPQRAASAPRAESAPSLRRSVEPLSPLPDEALDKAPLAAPVEAPEQCPREGPASAPDGAALTPMPIAAPGTSLRGELAAELKLDETLYPWLSSLGRNLTLLAARGMLDPIIGRDREIDEIVDILGKRRTNNPCLLGEPGVGKTAVVEGVAAKMLELAKNGLAPRIVLELDVASLVAGTQLRGALSEKLNGIKEEMRRADGRIICFIDELHTLVGAGSTGDGPQDAANELKSALARGEFPCIGATTHDEYRSFIQQDPALERRFMPVVVNEPTVEQTRAILEGVVPRYEEHHRILYSPEALGAAASLAARYVTDRFLPDKAISIVDLAGSRARREGRERVEPSDIARVVSRLAGIPEARLLLQDSERLLGLEAELGERIIGHRHAIERLAKVIRRNYAGFSTRRPMGSFLFLGPTGVGKTELARALADSLFGNGDALVRIDMTECSEQHGVAKLVGAPPGYVGHGEAGQLTEPVRKRPSCVVLLDEVEKAHRDVLMLLLQVLEEGCLTDAKGRNVDFSNTVVVLTTNLGAEAFAKGGAPLGFGGSQGERSNERNDERALELAAARVPAELWNRLDERLVFRPLEREEVAQIAHLLLTDSSERLGREKGIHYEVLPEVVEQLMSQGGFDRALGARPMRRAMQRLVEAPLADAILQGRFGQGDRIVVSVGSEGLAFSVVPGVAAVAAQEVS